MNKFGLMMDLPEGKLAGFYAQIVKNVAAAATIFDRDKELFIVDTAEDRDKVGAVLDKMKIDWEPMHLILLPESAANDDRIEDHGFTSKFGNAYLYADSVSLFRLSPEQPADAQTAPALMQMEELVILFFEDQEGALYCIDSGNRETAEGIARRYRCKLQFLK